MSDTIRGLPPLPQEVESDEISVKELLGILLAGWPVLVASACASLLAAAAYLFVTKPTYLSDALVQVESNQNSARVALSQTVEAMSSEVPVSGEVEILRSRSVLGKVVDRLGLDILAMPTYFPYVGEAVARRHPEGRLADPPWFLKAFANEGQSWGGESIVVSTFSVPEELLHPPHRLLVTSPEAYQLQGADGSVLGNGVAGQMLEAKSGERVIQLFVQSLTARVGTEFTLIKLRRELGIASIKSRLTVSASRTAEGMLTLTYVDQDARQAARVLTEILNVYQTQNIERRSAEAEQTLGFLAKQLPELRSQVETAEAKLNQFKVEQGTADLDQETAAVLQRSVELEQQRAELNQQRSEALQRYTENHPVVQAIDSQLALINQQSSKISGRVKQLPDMQQRALALSRDLQVNSALYISLLNRAQELEVVKSGTLGNIRIVDLPVVALGRHSPNAAGIRTAALAAGLVLGVLLIALLHLLRDGISDPAEIEKKLGLATYGVIPYSAQQRQLARKFTEMKTAKKAELLALADPQGITIEAIRSVRTALHFAQMDALNNIVMLTGPEPALGKSFVSANLGAVLAQSGKRVLIVDADLRRGHLHKMFGDERGLGLSEVVSASAVTSQVARVTPVLGLSYVSTGTLPPNPSELLINNRFVDFLREVSAQYDIVIIDTPPVLAVTDAAIIGRHAGTSLLVLKAGEHPMRMIEETVKRLLQAGVKVRGTLLNQAGRNRTGQYSYRAGYRYDGYQYAYKTQNAS